MHFDAGNFFIRCQADDYSRQKRAKNNIYTQNARNRGKQKTHEQYVSGS